MNFFSRSKKTNVNEEPVIIDSKKQMESKSPSSTSDSASFSLHHETEKVQEVHKEAEYVEENPIYEYSSSFLESISFNMYSESTQNEVKKTIHHTKEIMLNTWSKMKDAYKYVAELNEECILKELEDAKSYLQKNDGHYYSDVGLDVSI